MSDGYTREMRIEDILCELVKDANYKNALIFGLMNALSALGARLTGDRMALPVVEPQAGGSILVRPVEPRLPVEWIKEPTSSAALEAADFLAALGSPPFLPRELRLPPQSRPASRTTSPQNQDRSS
jgi:hypothetical protein